MAHTVSLTLHIDNHTGHSSCGSSNRLRDYPMGYSSVLPWHNYLTSSLHIPYSRYDPWSYMVNIFVSNDAARLRRLSLEETEFLHVRSSVEANPHSDGKVPFLDFDPNINRGEMWKRNANWTNVHAFLCVTADCRTLDLISLSPNLEKNVCLKGEYIRAGVIPTNELCNSVGA